MKLHRAIAFATLAFAAGLASAAGPRPFSQQEFDTLAREGKAVVVDVSATWCPTCKAQKPIVDAIVQQPAFREVHVLTVDFDADKPVLKQFKVGMQSTLIAFKGGKEAARSVGDTTATGIEGLFRKAMN